MAIFLPRWEQHGSEKPADLLELGYANDINRDVVAVFDGTRDIYDGTDATLYNGAQYIDNELVIGDEVDDYANLGKPWTPVGFSLPLTFVIDFTPTKIGVWNRLFKSSQSANNVGVNAQVNSSNKLIIAYGDNTGSDSQSRRSFTSDRTVALNERIVIAATLTGATSASLFVNGKKETYTTSGTGGAIAGASTNATVGRLNVAGVQYYNGTSRIRLVGLYESGRSDEELAALSEAPYQILKPRRKLFAVPSAATGQSITGNITLNQSPAAGFAHNQKLSGITNCELSPSAVFSTTQKHIGATELNQTPAAAWHYSQKLTGAVGVALTTSTVFKYSQKLDGATDWAISPGAAFGGSAAISGAVTFAAVPTAGFKLTQGISGDVALALSPVALFGGAASIVGSVALDLTPAAAMRYGQKLIGDTLFDVLPAALFGSAQAIAGNVDFSQLPGAVFKHRQKTSGNVALDLSPVSPLVYSQNITGTATFDLSPAAVFASASALAGSVLFSTEISASIKLTERLAGQTIFSLMPAAVMPSAPVLMITGGDLLNLKLDFSRLNI
jgi:hypothetical protein